MECVWSPDQGVFKKKPSLLVDADELEAQFGLITVACHALPVFWVLPIEKAQNSKVCTYYILVPTLGLDFCV